MVLTEHSKDERIMLRQELGNMMNAAAAGNLRFGAGEDVDYMRRDPDMLELRLTAHTFDPVEDHVPPDTEGYKFRLYFAEPPIEQTMLLALKFGRARRNGTIGLDEQDVHVDEASTRYVSWTRARAMKAQSLPK
ncbi:hypothetical protein [Arthrobacter sp. zg-Y1110]|uniref:hypothetical protein n=1 Tax=Arthrobacter sp. zg-Y1110 TaxID=2886932 RepID=UPI001D15A150|nr:hypothetical protein [Arthrobacter sp. zg-Y1110]MCC3292268.1 hypothetical protein [Arthrobacter sp. zg-Y1110]UWX85350.1 hypothetical protein N2K99_01920 [Arthrobacter sp. zg-Y1110]